MLQAFGLQVQWNGEQDCRAIPREDRLSRVTRTGKSRVGPVAETHTPKAKQGLAPGLELYALARVDRIRATSTLFLPPMTQQLHNTWTTPPRRTTVNGCWHYYYHYYLQPTGGGMR